MIHPTTRRLVIGLLAGRGLFPHLLAERIAGAGHTVVVAALRGQYMSRETPGISTLKVFPIGALGAVARFFADNAACGCIMAGGVKWNGVMRHVRLDRHAWAIIPRVLTHGDDGLLRAVATRLERLGVPVLDAAPYLGDLVASEGILAGPAPSPAILADIRIAWNAARHLGARDRGQAAMAASGRVTGLEDRRGTDALIARAGCPGAVLVKAVKPTQDSRFDMPAIGAKTAQLAATKKLSAIAIQAHGVLLLGRNELIQTCRLEEITLATYPAAGPG